MRVAKSEKPLHLYLHDATPPLSQCIHVGPESIHARKLCLNYFFNCHHYVILYRNVRDSRQMLTFLSQVFPLKLKYFKKANKEATSIRLGYLVVDTSPSTEDKNRLRAHVA